MRISDWSSDVCSSDLWLTLCFRWAFEPAGVVTDHGENGRHFLWLPAQRRDFAVPQALRSTRGEVRPDPRAVASDQGDRKSVVSGQSVSVRVDLGGRRSITTTKQQKNRNASQYT